jgi:hypothetical protein
VTAQDGTGSIGDAPKARLIGRVGAWPLGALALGAFAASLTLDWTVGTWDLRALSDTPPGGDIFPFGDEGKVDLSAGISTVSALGTVYIVGVIVLVGLLGAGLASVERAGRLRAPVTGMSLALLAVVVAITLQIRDASPAASALGGIFGFLGTSLTKGVELDYGLGIWFAYGALACIVGAAWLAALPARSKPAPAKAPADQGAWAPTA